MTVQLDAVLLTFVPIIYFSFRLGRYVERRLWLKSIMVKPWILKVGTTMMNKIKTQRHQYEHSQN